METKVTKHHFKLGSQKYFRGNAHLVQIGTYGEKKDPIGAKAYLDPQNKVKSEHIDNRLKIGTSVDIDWSESSKADVEASADLKFFSLGQKGAAKFTYSDAKNAKLKLINFYIMEGPLKAMLNKDANGARKYLAKEGGDGRIVSEVWVVVDAELASHFDAYSSTSASVKAFGSNIDITVSGGKSGSETIQISKGTTFAYKLHKVKDWNKGKTKIEDMEADYKGMG